MAPVMCGVSATGVDREDRFPTCNHSTSVPCGCVVVNAFHDVSNDRSCWSGSRRLIPWLEDRSLVCNHTRPVESLTVMSAVYNNNNNKQICIVP